MAMQYGQDMVGRGQEELKKNLDKYVSIGQLKYYFAVDTNYVGRKIGKNHSNIFYELWGFFWKAVRDPLPFRQGVPAVVGWVSHLGPTGTGLLGKCNEPKTNPD